MVARLHQRRMDDATLTLVSLAIGVVAVLYASVGHAGASGYIAVMTLCGFAASSIKPVALVLNILVATIGAWQFWRAGHFSWRLFWPFALLSVPAAFVGGGLSVSVSLLQPLLGAVLLFSAVRLFFRRHDPPEVSPPAVPTALAAGAGIGLLAGLTGTGGGIFLTPLLLFRGWARTRAASAVSALFILVNSMAGLLGHATSGQAVPSFAWVLAVAAVAGGALGSRWGSRHLPVRAISWMLAVVLILAGGKLIFA